MKDWDGCPKVFLEGDDVPTAAVGVECKRERSVGHHPCLNRLHVWWARRPLAVSRFALIGSLVGDDWSSEEVLELLGVPRGKDPVELQRRIDEANKRGERLRVAYGYDRAFKNPMSQRLLAKVRTSCRNLWGTEEPRVLDMFSGGGSIPFEAVRLGLGIESVELNPVACVVQRACLEIPLNHGSSLAKEMQQIGEEIASRIESRLTKYFPKRPGESIFAYIWVRSVKCPECGFDSPLTPNWWLDRKNNIGFRALVEDGNDSPVYTVARAGEDGFNPNDGSVTRGTGECVRCEQPIPGDHIKAEARAGRMGHQMAAIGYKMKGRRGRHFRVPAEEDLEAYEAAKKELEKRWPEWEAEGLIPTELYPNDTFDTRPPTYGMLRWCDFFNKRQLLTHLTTLKAVRNFEWDRIADRGKQEALKTMLAMAIDKGLDYNSLQSRLHASRAIITNTFDRHDFAFKWNYGEIDGAGHLLRFGISQVLDSYTGCASLLKGAKGSVELHCADARDVSWIPDETIHAVITDPPYYSNVFYGELSNFFYVWLRRSISELHPEWFSSLLVDRDSEAVANPARYRGIVGRTSSATKAAHQEYERKMTQAWQEAYRVLVPGGVLTIMFNHKQLEAWDALARSIIEAGFTITSSWAVSTESEHGLQIREKQAVRRTILLVARKIPRGEGVWWEDVRKELDTAVQTKLSNVVKETPHVSRVDLLMSAYGEGLRIVSQHWPVRDSRGGNLEIAKALTQARATLQDWYFEARLGHKPDFDTETKVVLYALEGYGGDEAAFDDIHKYGLALGLDVKDLYHGHIAERRRSKVKFLGAEERIRKTSRIDPERGEYVLVWDKLQAATLRFKEENAKDFRRWLRNNGFLADKAFLDACVFLASEGPAEMLETKMAKRIAPGGGGPPTGQTTLDDL